MKKWLSLCLSVVVVASLMLAACSKDGGNEANVETREPDENFNATGFPIVNEPIVVQMMGARHALVGEWKSLSFFQEMQKKTNIQFQFNTPPQADYAEKKNLAFASGEIPEVFFGSQLSTDDEITYGQQGILIPLEGLIEKYAPNIQKMFDDSPEIKQSVTAPDGHIYALPSVNQAPIARMPNMWINGNWLQKLGITELPKTTEEMYELLKAFKEKDPNGNGEPDEIPLTSIKLGDVRSIFLPAFGVLRRDHVIKDDKVVYGALQPEYKAYLEYMNRLWKEELLDAGTFSQTTEQKSAKGNAGQIGVFTDALPYLTLGGDSKNSTIHPLALAMTSPTNPDQPIVPEGSGLSRGTFAITNKSKNPEALIRWVDYLYGAEGEILVHYGVEGDLWEWADTEKKLRKYIEPEGMNIEEYRGGKVTPAVGVSIPMFTKEEVEANWDDPMHQHRIKEVDTKLKPYGKSPFPDIYLLPEERQQIQGIETDLNTYVESMEAKFVAGETSMDQWDTFVKTIQDMGVDKLLEVYQTSYDRWASAD
jgi:putative aldouronate transport system substrate-binding protein